MFCEIEEWVVAAQPCQLQRDILRQAEAGDVFGDFEEIYAPAHESMRARANGIVESFFLWLGREIEEWLQGLPYTYSQRGSSRRCQSLEIGRSYLVPFLLIFIFAGSMSFYVGRNLSEVAMQPAVESSSVATATVRFHIPRASHDTGLMSELGSYSH